MEVIGVIIVIAVLGLWLKGQMDLAKKKANKALTPKNKQPKTAKPSNQTPTYAKQDEDGNYLFEISGTHHYQDNLKKVVMAIAKEQGDEYDPEDSVLYDDISASLTLEPENPHDPNAVKVVIKGKHVGYLPKEYVAKFDNKTNKRCKAEIQGEENGYEVMLNLET